MSGHKLQTLQVIKIFGRSNAGFVKFYGATGLPTLVFANVDHSKGIGIQNGSLRLSNDGGIRLQ